VTQTYLMHVNPKPDF